MTAGPYTTEEIEDAIITALAPLKHAVTGLGVRTIKSYQGELAEEDIRKLLSLFPAIYVVYGGSDYPYITSPRKNEIMRWQIFVCDRTLRAEDEARRGGLANPGTYAMLHEVRDILAGSLIGLPDIDPFQIISETPVFFDNAVSIYAAEYRTVNRHIYPCT
jgi:phage gp37-like protein